MNYSDKLKMPQWQERRLQILQRDSFTCTCCNVYGKTVHVHHNYYLTGREPWEYPDTAYFTLCDECHAEEHSMDETMKQDLFESFKKAGFTNGSLIHIVLGLRLVDSLPASPNLVANAVGNMFANKGQFKDVYDNFKS